MPVDDRTRLNLHRKLEAVLGHDDADTLMAHLPPVTWDQVATTADVDAAADRVGTLLRTEMQVLGSELRTEFVEATNRQIKWLVTFAAAWTAVLVTLVRLVP